MNQHKIIRRLTFLLLFVALCICGVIPVLASDSGNSDADLVTTYGTIGDEYADADAFPLAVFSENRFVGAYSTWKDALYALQNAVSGEEHTEHEAQLLLRRDFTNYNNGTPPSINTATNILIDLGGHTFTNEYTGLDLVADYPVASYTTKIKITNGKMLMGMIAFVDTQIFTGTDAGEKKFDVTYDGITIGVSESAGTTGDFWGHLIHTTWTGNASTCGTRTVITLNDCTIDLSGYTRTDKNMTVFAAADGNNVLNVDVRINGGEIITADLAHITLYDGNSNESLLVGVGSDGSLPTLTVKGDYEPITDTFLTEDGGSRVCFTKVEGSTDKYELTVSEIITPYGVIPGSYKDVDKYPFAVFRNGSFVGAYGLFAKDATASALHSSKAAGSVILMRRDFTYAESQYNNLSQTYGVTLDLNGFTFTSTDRIMFSAQKKTAYDTNITVKNGKVVLGSTALMKLSSWNPSGKYPGGNGFNFTFDGVTIALAEGATTTDLICYNSFAAADPTQFLNITFNNCVFDLSKISYTLNMFDMTDAHCTTTAKISGGKIITSGSQIVFAEMENANAGSSITLTKPEGGNYTTLEIPSAKKPAVSEVNGGELVFVKSSDNGVTATYGLAPKAASTFVPKASIILGSELVFNIYVPNIPELTAISLDGAALDISALTEKDGYCLVTVPLGASEAAREIRLVATLSVGGKVMKGTFAFSIPKYAKKIVDDDNLLTDLEKTLVKDVLSYIRAGYAYFGTTDAEAMARIDALLGENYDESSAPVMNGSADKPTLGIKSVTYNHTAKPALRVYLADGFTASDFAFSINGSAVSAEEGIDENGKYVEVKLYAYEMAETVDYTVNGESDSCHIRCYYEWAKTQNNDNLVKLVERFARYCESAADYRDKVNDIDSCQHEFAMGKCTLCGIKDPDPNAYGTMTLTAPTEIYSNYPGKDIIPVFSESWYNGSVTYTTDTPNVFVENGKIFAKGIFNSAVNVTVTATTEYHTATATVKVSTYNGNINAETKIQYYEENIIKEENKGATIFVGDSYFDGYTMETPPFWKDFYQDFAGEKAFLMGLSSSQIHQLEIASERIVYPMEPKEIVVHIGHNDMHHGSLTVDEFVARLTALFNEYHARLPEAKIYYFSVDPKKTADDENSNRYESSFVKAPAVNAAIKALAESTDWLVYVDTTPIFYGNNETINKNMYPSSDASHPSLVAYDLMKLALDEARGVTRSDAAYINGLSAIKYKDKNGNDITGPFVASGKLVITHYTPGANVYVHFRMHQNYRFVFWDINGDGKFAAGYLGNGSASDNTVKTLYDGNDGLVINWAVITDESGKAYWYINGQLVHTFESYTPAYFLIGGENANSIVYDVEVSVKSDDPDDVAAYNAHAARYVGDVVNLETSGCVSVTNKTFTDASGDDLTDNYVIKGKLDISAIGKDNPYIQIRLGSGYRFLLWDSNNDGKLGAGYTENNSHVSDTESGITLYDASNGLTLDFAVVVNSGVAYWYINGNLEKRFATPNLEYFIVGAVQMNALFSDIEIYVKAEDEAAYYAEVAKYSALGVDLQHYDNNSNITANGKTFTDASGKALTNNYVVRGILNITELKKNNAHLQFLVGSGNRFILWDSDSLGDIGIGYQENGKHTNENTAKIATYDTTNGLILEWAVVVNEGKAYWYINGELMKIFAAPTLDKFNIGAQNMNVTVSNIEIFVKSENADLYSVEAARYLENALSIQKYGQGGDITASGRTYTDASGNALTNNYVVSGKLDITKFGTNGHLQFSFASGCRFLLWDSDSNGTFGAGYMYNGQQSDADCANIYDATNGITLEWAIVVNEGKAYWYINGVLVQQFDTPNLARFNIGALQMNVFLYDIEICAASDGDAAAYSAAVSKYLG